MSDIQGFYYAAERCVAVKLGIEECINIGLESLTDRTGIVNYFARALIEKFGEEQPWTIVLGEDRFDPLPYLIVYCFPFQNIGEGGYYDIPIIPEELLSCDSGFRETWVENNLDLVCEEDLRDLLLMNDAFEEEEERK